MAEYFLDQAWYAERDRLNAMSAHWDAGTAAIAQQCGLAPGWRVLEVGAGAGSVTRLFADAVGPSGSVLAVDIDPRLLADIDEPHVEIRQADVRVDDLPEASFDLVHARMVIEHLADAKRLVLERLVRSLRPGGWLFIEDLDWAGADLCWPPSEPVTRALEAAQSFAASAVQYDPRYGRTLNAEFRLLGLTDVGCTSRGVMLWSEPATGVPPYDLFAEQVMPFVLASGLLSEADYAALTAATHDGERALHSPLMFAAVGRRAL